MSQDVISIGFARMELGSIVRWVAKRHDRVTITDRGRPTAVLIGIPELSRLDQAAESSHLINCPTCSPGAKPGLQLRQRPTP
ncbi:type II toxin-antitoxin system Phd/YefM family antitoxin [Streptomyces sp. NPDC058864]